MRVSRGTALVLIALVSFLLLPLAIAQTKTLEGVSSFEPLPNGVELRAGSALVRITALRDDIVRVRIAPDGTLPEDASWAVLAESRKESVTVQPLQEDAAVVFRTKSVELRVERNPLRIVLRDLSGNVLCSDAPGRPTEFAHGGFSVSKAMGSDEHFYGLGDKTGQFDRRNQAFTLWNTDHGIQESVDPIYKSIPFFISINQGRSYGLFLDNTWRTWFDFGKSARDAYSFGAEGGPLDYYLIYGPTPKQVLEAYIHLTGTPPLPPLWALGFQQSRYSYTPESELRRIATRLRVDKIPSDTVYLDIDYQYRNRPFTVNPETFPGFPQLVADLKKQHLHLVTITDLHIAHVANQGYSPYDSGHAGDHFVKKADGSEYVGIVWPGPAVFPDFTREQTREWWGSLYKEFVQDGVSGFWNDMNEPSVFDGPALTMPIDNVHRIEEPGFATRTAKHAEIHNIFGMENERATHEGLLKLRPGERPFVLTRATFAGGQRYGFTWTGDNSSVWNHLRLGTQMVMNLGLSGISFVGDDVGGFGSSPSPELLTRWVEEGAFKPLFRDHASAGTLPQEVWVHGPEQEAIRRRYIETRYRLLPYIYTLAEEASRTGVPLVRPIFLEYPEIMAPDAPTFDNLDSEFLLGPDLLVAPPPFGETRDSYVVRYPPGVWYDFWTGKKMPRQPFGPTIVQVAKKVADPESAPKFEGSTAIHPALDTLPVYVRAGSILPMQAVVQSTDETPQGPLELRIYPGDNCRGSLYLDDGHTFRYQQGEFLRQEFTCQQEDHSLRVTFGKRTGTFAPWWKSFEIIVVGWSGAVKEARLSDRPSPLVTHVDPVSRSLHVVVPDVSSEAELMIMANGISK